MMSRSIFLGQFPIKISDDLESANAGGLKAALKATMVPVVPFHADEFLQQQVWGPLRFSGARQKIVDGCGRRLQAELQKLLSQISLRIRVRI